MAVVNRALPYPVGSGNEQLRAALVQLIDVVRINNSNTVTTDVEELRGDVTTLEGDLAAAETELNAALASLEVDLAVLQSDFANLVAEALTAQQLLEISIDHASEAVQGSRAEFERWVHDEHIRIMESVVRLRQLVQNNSAAIIDEQVVRVSETEAFASQMTGVVADLADTTALVVAEQTARATADTALSTNVTAIEASVAANTASITSLSSAVATADAAMAADIDVLQTDVVGNTAAITAEALTRSTADTALAGQITSLTTTVGANTAAITAEALTRSTEDAALAAQIDTVEAATATNAAAITAETAARATADTALAVDITALTASVGTNSAAITNEAIARANADTSLAVDITALTTSVGINAAAITNETIARTNGDTALAATINDVATTVGGHTASITELASSVDGISAKWGISVNVDGEVVGMVSLDGSASESAFTVAADKFVVANPNAPTDTSTMFGVGLVDGVTSVGIFGNAIIDGTVLARHITVGSLDAISANLGTVTAGVIQSPGGETYWNLATGETRFAYYTNWIEGLETTVSAADAALNTAVTDVLAAVGLIEADVAVLQSNELTPQQRFEIALDHAVDTVSGSRREFQLWMEDELRRISELVLQVRRHTTDNSANITFEQLSRVTETEAFASQLSALTADLGTTNAAVVAEQVARATGDSALASSVSTVEAGIASNSASITTIQTVQTGIQSDVTAIQSDVTGIETDLGQVQAQWGVALNVNDQVTGLIQLDGSASGSQFTVVADKFVVAHPSAPGTLITPVVVGLVNGVSTIGLTGSVVIDGTILTRHIAAGSVTAGTLAAGAVTATKIDVGSLSAINANAGTITAGVLKSSDNLFVIDLNAKTITITT